MTDASLGEFITRHPRLFVLTGAGCSTASGIPDYRDDNGDWKRARPVMLQPFLASELTRQRYWARSLVGWHRMSTARPNGAHLALAKLERLGRVEAWCDTRSRRPRPGRCPVRRPDRDCRRPRLRRCPGCRPSR